MQPVSTLQAYLNALMSPIVVAVASSLRSIRKHVDTQNNTIISLQSTVEQINESVTTAVIDAAISQWSPNFTTSRMMTATIQSAALTLYRPTKNGQAITSGSFILEATFTQNCTLAFDANLQQTGTGQLPQIAAGQYLLYIDAFPTNTYIRIHQL